MCEDRTKCTTEGCFGEPVFENQVLTLVTLVLVYCRSSSPHFYIIIGVLCLLVVGFFIYVVWTCCRSGEPPTPSSRKNKLCCSGSWVLIGFNSSQCICGQSRPQLSGALRSKYTGLLSLPDEAGHRNKLKHRVYLKKNK